MAGTPCASRVSPARSSSGVIPADAELTKRHDEIPAWEQTEERLRPVLARQMEIYAGFLEQTDHHVGRVIDTSRTSGVLEDTLVYYIIGDNGASAEGTQRRFNEMMTFNGMAAHRDRGIPARQVRQVRNPRGVQPLRRGLGTRDVHAVSVDQAGGLALGRDPQRHDRPLARRARGPRRDAGPVPPRHRRGADRAGGGRTSASHRCERHLAGADGGV